MKVRNWKCGFQIMFAVVMISSILLPSALWAQGASTSNVNKNEWRSLESVRVGDKIRVVQTDSKAWKGRFLALSEEAISLRVNGNAMTIERPKVLRVESREKNKRLRNALIGMAIGGGIGLAIGIPSGRDVDDGHVMSLVGFTFGAALGGGFGSAVPGHPTIYEANSSAEVTAARDGNGDSLPVVPPASALADSGIRETYRPFNRDRAVLKLAERATGEVASSSP
jgi:hypothetical protein